MTEPLTCITNTMADTRGCTIRDEHYADYHDSPDHLATCNGCVPRPTRVGFVCGPCFNRIEDALQAAGPWFQMLEGVDHAIRRDTINSGKPGSSVPIPPVPLTFEEIESYHRSFTGTAERWVADRTGAQDAVRFARAMEAASRNHPTAETPHHIKRTRCPICEKLTLVWNPPQYFGGHVRVTCRDQTCTFEADQRSFETIATIEKPGKAA
jgi:hypothetical protein